ncbi:cell envelope integrity protein TolA [Ramlibacter sp. PS4R-6]|uniref:cell envelope integrity protein TolA n=1 Tax=Ramlibacter sp. PS4R-6 TaxID=3133438 RepID=UPI0030A207CB
MQATADSLAFAPPREPAAVRGFLLAAVAHILLIVALTWGITWDKSTAPVAVEAELWSALPQEAAPPPPPPPPPQQQVVTAPPVAPPPPVVEPKAPDITIEREKKRQQEEARRHEEEERRKLEAQKKRLEEQRWLAEEKRQREELAKKEKARQELDAKKREQLRKEQIARMQALASGGGSPSAQGTAQKSSGPSDSYAGRIRARVKPNIVFTDDVPGNPSAEVEVRMAPDGTIIARKVTKPSGVKSWDDAVLRALDKTEMLPRDVDGRVHTPLIIEFKLRG